VDAYHNIHPSGPNEATVHNFGRANPPTPIDWILVSQQFRVLDEDVDDPPQ
jgi:endonuclease/exonuclease/phosphatase family metal-dependent hydrolase